MKKSLLLPIGTFAIAFMLGCGGIHKKPPTFELLNAKGGVLREVLQCDASQSADCHVGKYVLPPRIGSVSDVHFYRSYGRTKYGEVDGDVTMSLVMKFDYREDDQPDFRTLAMATNFGAITDARGHTHSLAAMTQLCVYSADRQNDGPLACGPVENR